MATAKIGDKVQVHYSGFLEDGTEFDSSEGRDPLEFVLGERDIIVGFQKAVEGLKEGEKVSVSIQPEDGYGERDLQMIARLPRQQLPTDMEPQVGMQLAARDEDGQVTHVTITDVGPDGVTIDGNHAMAGKVLKFDLELVKIG